MIIPHGSIVQCKCTTKHHMIIPHGSIEHCYASHFGGLLPRPRFKPSSLGNLYTRSKSLNHWTISGALYFWESEQGFTPHSSPQASRLLSRGVFTCWWVSEMLKRSVEESKEKHAAVRSGRSTVSRTVILAACVMCEYHASGSPLWRTFRCCSNFCPYRGSNPCRWGTSAPEAKVLTTGPPAVPYTFRIGAGLYSTTCK